jgi:hypothetical protein
MNHDRGPAGLSDGCLMLQLGRRDCFPQMKHGRPLARRTTELILPNGSTPAASAARTRIRRFRIGSGSCVMPVRRKPYAALAAQVNMGGGR